MFIQDGEFDWNKSTQGLVLGAFFWGYLITQIPGGWIAAKFGGKRVFGWCMFTCALSTLLMPVAARVSPIFLMVLRFIAGLGQVGFLATTIDKIILPFFLIRNFEFTHKILYLFIYLTNCNKLI